MRRLFTLLLTLSLLALPSAALAQSAGDEQYADPFGQVDQPSGSQGEGDQTPAEPAPEPAPAPAPAPAPSDGSDGVAGATDTQVVQQTDSPTLPATGLPAGLLAGTGALLLTAGTALRRRLS
jgi:hypothetical protein